MLLQRIIGVFKLDTNTFEEIERDTGATGQAALVVAIVALLSGVGAGLASTLNPEAGGSFLVSFLGWLVWTFVGWLLWSVITYLVGTSLFGGQANVGEMLRVIGFAQAPQILGIIPCIGSIIGAIWSLVAGFVAVRQGLDLDNTKAFLTILIGFVVYLIGFCLLFTILGGLGAAVGSFAP